MGASTAVGENRAKKAITTALDSPLLNDNKITGAKNVLLLIVSGNQEITIDEIGEINDHIQAEAGYGANIIMGVGEDEKLGEAISVTVIATGFDVDQQNDITNVEPKKVVHALEDEQIMKHDLTAPQAIDSLQNTKGDEFATEETIVYSLEDDSDLYDFEEAEANYMDLIPTTELIKSIDVVAAEVVADVSEDEFIINEVFSEPKQDEIAEVEEQTMLTFDLPLQQSTSLSEINDDVEIFELEDNVNDIEVDDYIELIAVNESSSEDEQLYSLDDHIILENTNEEYDSSKESATKETQVDTELMFSKVTVKERKVTKAPVEDEDPFNNPISKTLRDRADERRKKMKAFNYKFNTSKVDEFEKEPAYKRKGVELNDTPSSEQLPSRATVSLDENEDVQLRSNNSFLHDNVD
jgi:cell division protein FtsZ